MSPAGRGERLAPTVQATTGREQASGREPVSDWVAALTEPGPEQVVAMRQLHQLMVRAAGHQVWRMRAALPDPSPSAVEELVHQAADEAMARLLTKLHTFEGRSRFTTWAYKFAIVQAGTEVRRLQWQHRPVELRDVDVPGPAQEGPELQAEAGDLARAVASAMHRVLSPYQRRIAVALLVDEVPIDVLAERLGTTRGALYKTLHEARVRLRAELAAHGYLTTPIDRTPVDRTSVDRTPAERAPGPGAAVDRSPTHRTRTSGTPQGGTP